jgi:hypothetical protein
MIEYKIAVIEDDPKTRDSIIVDIKQIAADIKIGVDFKDFKNSKSFHDTKGNYIPDILVFDLNKGPDDSTDRSGWEAIREVMNNEFTPSILYSAHADEDLPQDLKDLYIMKIPKTVKGLADLKLAAKKAILMKNCHNMEKNRIIDEFRKISLNSFKQLLPYSEKIEFEETVVTQMAVARVISVLKNIPLMNQKNIPPETMFLVPALEVGGSENCILQGDLINEKNNGSDSIFLVSSPACDLIKDEKRKRKIDKVLLLHCFRTKNEFKTKNSHRTELDNSNFKNYLKGGACHLIKCPKSLSESGFLLIVFKNYKTIDFGTIQAGITNGEISRIATIATPFAESIHNSFIADLSRIGTPDIEKDEDQWKKDFLNYPTTPPHPTAQTQSQPVSPITPKK